MIQQLTGKQAVSASELSRQTGVRQQNLSRWLAEARSLPLVATDKPIVRKWTVEQKAHVLAEASRLSGEQLTAYLEREGVKLADFEQWRLALARLMAACKVVGISARTIERWRNRPGGDDGRCGPHHRPRNALSVIEEAQIISVLTSSRYAELSPKQLVPQLADEGLYLASESTLYRIQRRHGLRSQKRTASRTHVTRACAVHEAVQPTRSGAGT
jgi:hypothetical protein